MINYEEMYKLVKAAVKEEIDVIREVKIEDRDEFVRGMWLAYNIVWNRINETEQNYRFEHEEG